MGFHPRCRKTGITHLVFVDDLMVSTNGMLFSVSSLSSTIICSGLTESWILELVVASGFKQGTLPIRYLGIPLISSRLKVSYNLSIIEPMIAQTKSWASKSLSFIRHLQLIGSVFHSLVNYWFQHFILPKKVIKQIQQIWRAFLLKGVATHSSGARIS